MFERFSKNMFSTEAIYYKQTRIPVAISYKLKSLLYAN